MAVMFLASLDSSGPPAHISHGYCGFCTSLRLAAHSRTDRFSLRHTCLLSIIKKSSFLTEESRSRSDFSLQLTDFHESCFIAARIAG